MIETKLTVKEIQLALYNSTIWNTRQYLFVPNVSYGLFDYEVDLAIMSKSGYVTEIEIKRSWEDFLADFHKKHTHNDVKVYDFYYCVPECLAEKVENNLSEHFSEKIHRPAVLLYTEEGGIKQTKIGWCHNYGAHRKLFLEEQLQLARLGTMRYWNLINKQ